MTALTILPLKAATVRDLVWEEMFLRLEDYRDLHGTVEVKNTLIFRGMSLGRWVKTQRESQAKGKLPADRAARLAELGMEWMPHHQSRWEKRYELLLLYRYQHGNVEVPQSLVTDGVPLGVWVGKQRMKYRSGQLSPERVALLEKAGVSREKQKRSWSEVFSILEAYREEYGHVDAPDGFVYRGLQLGTWLQTQRRAYRVGTIGSERIAALENVGVVWSLNDASWERHFGMVCAYKEMHRTANVPARYVEGDVKLGTWIKNQRIAFKKGTLLAERQVRLESLGVRL
ncbi:hypothetical protein MB46_19500 (plasmid) [Arthrobacter alpinus]|uniref:helicase associated domain-containing protein n=1 Tax=Arthrobacter alpinus TaxID=656366 RepID=UPI0005CAFD00|nr:helicase associated domain-containing protein [Arthrobacter alpinus]ALV47860.1 hypothetical protein MB46_19500 [Arthrobacter alpinus]